MNAKSRGIEKLLKIINFESTKLVGKGGFYFVVSHRFGSVKNGFENLFGLDEAVTHLNFIYGLTEGINVSASRSSNQKIYEFVILPNKTLSVFFIRVAEITD